MSKKLNAEELKVALWETYQGLVGGNVSPEAADSMARIAREIMRVHSLQLRTLSQANRPVSKGLVGFADPPTK